MRAVVAGTQAEQMSEARRILLSEGVDCQAGDVVAYDRLPDSLAATLPDVVLVFCNGSLSNGSHSESLAAIRTAHQLAHGLVLAVGEPAVSLVRDAMRAGAGEFIDVNNLRQDLAAAVVNIENVNQGASKRGRIVSVFSPVGGSGVSTIAVNLAISMLRSGGQGKEAAAESATGVALLDLNPAPSDVSLLLDITPKHTLTDVGQHRDRLDRRLLSGAMTVHPSGLHVLPQSGFTSGLGLPSWDVDPGFVRQLFVLLRKMYEYVVVDLGHTLDHAQVEAMRLSNLVLLATIADVPGLRRVRWATDTAHSLGVSRDRFQVVLARYAKRHHVNHEKVGDALNLPILAEIVDDGAIVTAARNEGTPLVEMSTKAGKNFAAFARKVQAQLSGVTG